MQQSIRAESMSAELFPAIDLRVQCVTAIPTITSIQVGRIRTYESRDRAGRVRRWNSAIAKTPVNMPVPLGQRGLQHDTHADSRSHGGADKAVLAYSGDHYPDWSSRLDLPLLQPGGFGENLTVSGLTEEDVCLGDRWRVREIELEVSQPRQPCAKLGLRWRLPALTSLVAESGRTGWYLRVRRGGVLSAPAVIERIARPHPEWTVARANACLFGDRATRGEFAELLAIPELSGEWKRSLG